jgi:hypothetical protein
VLLAVMTPPAPGSPDFWTGKAKAPSQVILTIVANHRNSHSRSRFCKNFAVSIVIDREIVRR